VTSMNSAWLTLERKKINFSTVFAGQVVGIKEVHDDIWVVSFMDYDLGYFDLETRVLEPLENPFGPKVLLNRPIFPHFCSVWILCSCEATVKRRLPRRCSLRRVFSLPSWRRYISSRWRVAWSA